MKASVAIGLLAILACSGPTPQRTVTTQPPVSPDVVREVPASAAANVPEPKLEHTDWLESTLELVAKERALEPRAAVKGEVVPSEIMVRELKRWIDEQVPREAVLGEQAFLRTFGFIPPDYDYTAGTLNLMRDELVGYYDPTRKRLFLLDGLSERETSTTLTHELVHALQDQHFGLTSLVAYRKGASDARAAIHCLAEGDAQLATTAALSKSLRVGEAGVVEVVAEPPDASIPRFLWRSLLASYADGLTFVRELSGDGGWGRINEVWRNPPTTTEQVLHRDKYLNQEPAEDISDIPLPPLTGEWAEFHRDSYGEQALRIAMEHWISREHATLGAAGWAGDQVLVARRMSDQTTLAAWLIRFDSTAGNEAAEAKQAEALLSQGKGPYLIGEHTTVYLARNHRDLVLVAGPNRVKRRSLERWATKILQQVGPVSKGL